MPHRKCILDLIKEGDTVVEVGVWKGDFSSKILDQSPGKLYLVDPWKTFEDGKSRWYSIDQSRMDAIYENVVNKFKDNPGVCIERLASLESNPIDEIDLVYIDGDHSYKAVKDDLNHWWPKIKLGGWLTGDDWEWKDKDDPSREGPKPAVNEFVLKHGLVLHIKNNQWWFQKL